MSNYMGPTSIAKLLSLIKESLSLKVSISRTINGKALSEDITLSASDVGAMPEDVEIPSITISSITNEQIDIICGTSIINAEDIEF